MTEKKMNRLTQKQIWEISRHIEENIGMYEDVSFLIIAIEMSKIFNYNISVANISGIKKITGMKIGLRPRIKPNNTSTKDDVRYIASLLLNTNTWNGNERLLSIVNKNKVETND